MNTHEHIVDGGCTNPHPGFPKPRTNREPNASKPDLSRRRSVLVDSPPRPLAAKRPEERVSIAHSIVGGPAWERPPWRAVQRAAWETLRKLSCSVLHKGGTHA
jgi:hypothetical protein